MNNHDGFWLRRAPLVPKLHTTFDSVLFSEKSNSHRGIGERHVSIVIENGRLILNNDGSILII